MGGRPTFELADGASPTVYHSSDSRHTFVSHVTVVTPAGLTVSPRICTVSRAGRA